MQKKPFRLAAIAAFDHGGRKDFGAAWECASKILAALHFCPPRLSTPNTRRLNLGFSPLAYRSSPRGSHSRTIIVMAEPTSDALLFEEQFEITNVDHKKYDRAARITASSLDRATSLELDINTELFPLTATENIEVALATTLNLDGSGDDEKTWRDVAKPGVHTLADGYNYVCYGKVYKFEDGKADKTL